MTATTYPSTPARPARATLISRTLKAEWTKLRTLPSTWRTAALTLAMGVGFSVAVAFSEVSQWHTMTAQQREVFDPTSASMSGVMIAAVVLGALAVRTVTAEYSTGMIRSSFCAVPKRLPVLWGKAIVFGAVAFAISLPSVFIVFFIGQGVLSGRHINIALSHPGVVRAMFGAALFLTVMGLFGLGLGAIVRNTAGGIAALAAIVFVLPPVMSLLPSSISNAVDPYLPSNAGGAVWTITPDPGTLAPWTGFALFCGYAALALAIAAVLMVRRDT